MQLEASPAPALSYTFAWDRREFARFYRAHTRHARLGVVANLCIWGFVAMTAFNVLYTAYIAATRGIGTAAGMLPWVLMMVAYVAYFRLFAPAMVARRWEKQNCCAAHPTTRELSDDGLRIHCAMRDTKLAWPAIRRVVETKEFLIFFQTERYAHYLPKHALGGAAELQRVRGFLIRHTPVQSEKGLA
ncbi:YcxB family protein [Longimicrobium sp.]|uniref:YcxB family protein n=1 Tax=Longimicrobium sp. TaxID=2029185 RepID=UPI002C2136F6|nr:YcxB family protein [Longimicrobium sp.]HSU14911.1 YcxB family protein [Longimicrobium sp.]